MTDHFPDATKKVLSPAAQAVLDAYWDDAPLESGARCGLAAALRAAADQVVSPVPPPCGDFDEHAQGFLAAHVHYRAEFLAIAADLVAQPSEDLPEDDDDDRDHPSLTAAERNPNLK